MIEKERHANLQERRRFAILALPFKSEIQLEAENTLNFFSPTIPHAEDDNRHVDWTCGRK